MIVLPTWPLREMDDFYIITHIQHFVWHTWKPWPTLWLAMSSSVLSPSCSITFSASVTHSSTGWAHTCRCFHRCRPRSSRVCHSLALLTQCCKQNRHKVLYHHNHTQCTWSFQQLEPDVRPCELSHVCHFKARLTLGLFLEKWGPTGLFCSYVRPVGFLP